MGSDRRAGAALSKGGGRGKHAKPQASGHPPPSFQSPAPSPQSLVPTALIDHLFIIGYPSAIGGANTELWHTVKLWRRFGLGITLLPTWHADEAWRARLDAIGCRTIVCQGDALPRVPGLAGSVVVSFCNTKFLAVADRIARLGCRTIWLGCMNWLFPQERLHYRRFGPFDRHVFQSRHQHDQLVPPTPPLRIPGAPGADHPRGDGRRRDRLPAAAARGRASRWWSAASAAPIPTSSRPRCGGRTGGFRIRSVPVCWAGETASRPAPARRRPGPSVFRPGASRPRSFSSRCTCWSSPTPAAVENWPRVGLEAMAAGVPLVVDAKGGWLEMLRHGRTGYLCRTDDELAYYTARLAYDEGHRLRLVRPCPRGPRRRVGRPARPLAAMARVVRELGTEVTRGTVPIFAQRKWDCPLGNGAS